jgi:hypothetical protein
MGFYDTVLDRLGHLIASRIGAPDSGYEPFTPSDPVTLAHTLRPADVLLVEGNQKVSTAIKYLTQSTWSHSAIYVGNALGAPEDGSEPKTLIEVNLGEGAVAVPLSKYASYNTRICRPVGLTLEDRARVVDFMVKRLGLKYDMRNVVDLVRYLFPTPPVPVRWRRRMMSLGSGEPTRAICSTLIAQAFQTVRYPILPKIQREPGTHKPMHPYSRREILMIRHHSLFAPRDFDLSPYFEIIKPTIERGFDYRTVKWAKSSGAGSEETAQEPGKAAGTDPPQERLAEDTAEAANEPRSP